MDEQPQKSVLDYANEVKDVSSKPGITAQTIITQSLLPSVAILVMFLFVLIG